MRQDALNIAVCMSDSQSANENILSCVSVI